jgi:DUF1365 family protein
MYIDLDELDGLQNRLSFFSKSWFSPYTFISDDYLPNSDQSPSLQERVRNFVGKAGVKEQIKSIRLLTNVRFCGYVFNPVSFFFCFDSEERAVCCLTEVGNTFGEKKGYVLLPSGGDRFRDRQEKLFYISPFTELNQDLVFNLAVPGGSVNLSIDTKRDEMTVVSSSLKGRRLSFTDANLLRLTLRYPMAPARVIALIHIHAFILWLKKTPYHRKEEHLEQQVAVLNPHYSLRRDGRG